jgi:hypothetical protein
MHPRLSFLLNGGELFSGPQSLFLLHRFTHHVCGYRCLGYVGSVRSRSSFTLHRRGESSSLLSFFRTFVSPTSALRPHQQDKAQVRDSMGLLNHCQPVTPPHSPRFQHGPSATCAHASEKTMLAPPRDLLRLIGSLWHRSSSLSRNATPIILPTPFPVNHAKAEPLSTPGFEREEWWCWRGFTPK